MMSNLHFQNSKVETAIPKLKSASPEAEKCKVQIRARRCPPLMIAASAPAIRILYPQTKRTLKAGERGPRAAMERKHTRAAPQDLFFQGLLFGRF